jgi:hypothetical protein
MFTTTARLTGVGLAAAALAATLLMSSTTSGVGVSSDEAPTVAPQREPENHDRKTGPGLSVNPALLGVR